MGHDEAPGRPHDRWAHLRLAVVGVLLAAPPKKGDLQAALTALAERTWHARVSNLAWNELTPLRGCTFPRNFVEKYTPN
jgi:hypothetical protein